MNVIFEGSVGVRPTIDKEVAGIPQPPLTLPDLDPRYVAGCALVRRCGSIPEISAMEGNQAELRKINANTRAWLKRARQAA